jgi:hypothetical protein
VLLHPTLQNMMTQQRVNSYVKFGVDENKRTNKQNKQRRLEPQAPDSQRL